MTDVALAIARAVRESGGRALIVGGWVRDRLMGLESKDVDLEVYGMPAPGLRELLGRFGPVNAVGESFTVFKGAGIDVALPRRESKMGRGHKGFEVHGDPDLTPREAARRRDFTINAISWDPLTETCEDPFDGRGDIERRVLRAVDPSTFGEDSLRVLRAIQFAARFEFTLDPATDARCRRIPLDDLPSERIWGEFEKLLLQARRPSIGFELALRIGVVDALLPDVDAAHRVDVETIEDGGRRRDARLLVIDRSDPSVHERGGWRLAEIVADRPEHDGDLLRMGKVVDARARLVDHHQRMDPDVPFRMPLGLLRTADERFQLREQRVDDAEAQGQLEPDGRPPRLEEELFEFPPDPLRREIIERDPPAERFGRRVQRELEPGRELDRAQHTQAVLPERGGIHRPEYAPFDVAAAVEGVLIGVGERIPRDRVDREVAAAGGFTRRQLRIPVNVEPFVPAPHLRLAARERDVEAGHLEDGEALADRVHRPEPREQRAQFGGGYAIDLEVHVLRLAPHETVADPAADDQRTPAAFAHGPGDRERPIVHAWGFRRRPYRRTNRSVNAGASAFITVSARESA